MKLSSIYLSIIIISVDLIGMESPHQIASDEIPPALGFSEFKYDIDGTRTKLAAQFIMQQTKPLNISSMQTPHAQIFEIPLSNNFQLFMQYFSHNNVMSYVIDNQKTVFLHPQQAKYLYELIENIQKTL